MFAAGFILEKDPVAFEQLPSAVLTWVHVLGSVSMFILLIWGLSAVVLWLLGHGTSLFHGLTGRLAAVDRDQVWKPRTFWLMVAVTVLGVAAAGVCMAVANSHGEKSFSPTQPRPWTTGAFGAFTLACLGAVFAVSWEFLTDLPKLHVRRIWALALFSMKEAIRRKALWTFVVILILFLFASWFIQIERAQDQWRTYVELIFFVTTALLLVTASVLACFSLPGDIRMQTIHTVVTKPVQRFEIVLGRIVGFGLLMTLVLLVMAHLSLFYVFRVLGNEEARSASIRARVPLWGELSFEELDQQGNWKLLPRGENVGREWEYRQYVRGGSTQEAVWRLRGVPQQLKDREWIPIEFTFDIFRTSKGGDQYKEGVSCQFMFINTRKWDYSKQAEYRDAKNKDTGLPLTDREKAKEFGYYELPAPKNVLDYQIQSVRFPGAVLEDLGPGDFQIRVGCRSHSQYLGMARRDLYVLADEGNAYVNYLKGVLGIWFLMMLVVTLGVVFSTYLSAMVGWLLTWMLLICGMGRLREFITLLGEPVDRIKNPGGGAVEAFIRVIRSENMMTPLEQSTGIRILLSADEGFRYVFQGLLNIVPNLDQYWRTMWVAEGFNIPGSDILASLLLLVGYLYPFLLAGYYLINAREIAG